MLKVFLKILLFPLMGLVLALAYPLIVGDSFKEEEIKFEARTLSPELKPGLKGVTETDWEGKRVLLLEAPQSVFPFSTRQKNTIFLQASYYLRSSADEKIKILINDSFLQEILLNPSTNRPGQLSLSIPFSLLTQGENVLKVIRPDPVLTPLYLDSLKIRNYKGYSTGLIAAYILPLPLNPPLLSRIKWPSPMGLFLIFILVYSLFGLIYGLVLSRRRKTPFLPSIGNGSITLLPGMGLLLIMAAVPLIISGHLIVSLKSFIVLNAGLTLIAIAVQIKLIRPLIRSLIKWLQKSFRKKELVVLLVITGTLLSVLYLYSFKFNKNITGFMVIGDYFEAPQIWTPHTLIHRGSVGYDGQFYYYIAHDPFILSHSFNHIDFPAYRYQRIIYPLSAWLLSFGQPELIPYMLVVVNLLGIILGTYFVILILNHFGRSPWYGLFYGLFWGFLLCLLRSLPEPLATTFVAMSVYFYLKEKTAWQILSLTLAALTQETTLMVSLAFLFYHFRQKEYRKSIYMLFPPLAYFSWQLYIFHHFQTFSFLGGTQNFGPPFQGILEKLLRLGQGSLSYAEIAEGLFLSMILGLILLAFYDVIKYYGPFTLSFAGYALLTVFLNKLIWVEPWSYARATLGLLFFNLLIFTKEKGKLNLIPMLLIPVIFILSLISMRLL